MSVSGSVFVSVEGCLRAGECCLTVDVRVPIVSL